MVIRDVTDFAVVVGSPARRVGWVGRVGVPLVPGDVPGSWTCPRTGERYVELDGILREEEDA